MGEREKLIGTLRIKVEEKLGRKLAAPTDFNRLILSMQEETGETLSLSTLKRIWKCADPAHRTSDTSLLCLARFVGNKDWYVFLDASKKSGETDSDFLIDKQIHADALRRGDMLEMRWKLDRYCRIMKLEKDVFKVLECVTENLKPAIFSAQTLFRSGFLSVSPTYIAEKRCLEHTLPDGKRDLLFGISSQSDAEQSRHFIPSGKILQGKSITP